VFHVNTDQCTHIINTTSFALRYSDMLQPSRAIFTEYDTARSTKYIAGVNFSLLSSV